MRDLLRFYTVASSGMRWRPTCTQWTRTAPESCSVAQKHAVHGALHGDAAAEESGEPADVAQQVADNADGEIRLQIIEKLVHGVYLLRSEYIVSLFQCGHHTGRGVPKNGQWRGGVVLFAAS